MSHIHCLTRMTVFEIAMHWTQPHGLSLSLVILQFTIYANNNCPQFETISKLQNYWRACTISRWELMHVYIHILNCNMIWALQFASILSVSYKFQCRIFSILFTCLFLFLSYFWMAFRCFVGFFPFISANLFTSCCHLYCMNECFWFWMYKRTEQNMSVETVQCAVQFLFADINSIPMWWNKQCETLWKLFNGISSASEKCRFKFETFICE